MTKDEMLQRMSMDEYIHWVAIYETEPFPEERADYRNAQQMINIRRALGSKDGELKDFMPDWWGDRQPQQQTPAQIKANMQLVKAAAKKRRKGN